MKSCEHCCEHLSYNSRISQEGLTMEKRLQKVGNRRGVILPTAVLDHMGATDSVTLTIVSNGRVVLTAPIAPGRRQSLREALASTNAQYGSALQRLSEPPTMMDTGLGVAGGRRLRPDG